MDEGEEPRARGQSELHPLRIERETPAGREMKMAENEGVQSRQAVEKGIGGGGRQHLVARVGEELEQVRVRPARRSRQDEVLRRHRVARPGKSGGQRLASLRNPQRMRL